MTAQDRNSGEDKPQPHGRAEATSLFQTQATLSTAMRAPPYMCGGRMPLFVLGEAPQGQAWRGKGGVVFVGEAPTPAQTLGWRCVLEWTGAKEAGSHGGHCLCCVGRGGLDQFLLAQAQSRVRGVGEPLEVMVVVCAPQQVAVYKTRLENSVFLSAFYALQP
ncbi:hypothetical protein PY793_07255 [Acetobacter fabarum]|uniref:hypothetical protein n=1 Tax=Acetobacter fabarum TaxID=483199 RepID=UPI00312BA109